MGSAVPRRSEQEQAVLASGLPMRSSSIDYRAPRYTAASVTQMSVSVPLPQAS